MRLGASRGIPVFRSTSPALALVKEFLAGDAPDAPVEFEPTAPSGQGEEFDKAAEQKAINLAYQKFQKAVKDDAVKGKVIVCLRGEAGAKQIYLGRVTPE